jgi:hypothetical protein
MQQTIEEYVRRSDKCQTRKGKHEFRAPVGGGESFGTLSSYSNVYYRAVELKTSKEQVFVDLHLPLYEVRRNFPHSRFGRNLCKSLRNAGRSKTW